MSFQEVADQSAAYALRIMELERRLGECEGALQTAGHPIEWQAKIDAAVASERERLRNEFLKRHGQLKARHNYYACLAKEMEDGNL